MKRVTRSIWDRMNGRRWRALRRRNSRQVGGRKFSLGLDAGVDMYEGGCRAVRVSKAGHAGCRVRAAPYERGGCVNGDVQGGCRLSSQDDALHEVQGTGGDPVAAKAVLE